MRRWLPLAAALVLAACGAPSREEAVAIATQWVSAVRAGDFQAACDLQLESAVRGLRVRYLRDRDVPDCPSALRAFAGRISAEKFSAFAELEPHVPHRGQVGVFPSNRLYRFEVLLLRRSGDAWKIASIGITPDD